MTKHFARGAKRMMAISLAALVVASEMTAPMIACAEEQSVVQESLELESTEADCVTEQNSESGIEEETISSESTESSTEEEVISSESTEGSTEEETTSSELKESSTEETTSSELTESSTEEEITSSELTESSTEEETTAVEETEESVTESTEIENEMVALTAVDHMTVSLFMTSDMIAGSTYMDGMVSVGTDMLYTASDVTMVSAKDANVTYSASGYVSNKTNPNATDGTGALLRFTPKYDGTIQIGGQIGANKTFYVDIAGGNHIYEYVNGAEKANLIFEDIAVEAGNTYYLYGAGTKMRFYALNYMYDVDTETETEEEVVEIPQTSDFAAFPGAEGGGKYITGGRGRQVYTVTNLNDDGEGSLRWAIEQTRNTEGGTIVFNVSGNIELKSSLRFNGIKNVTIAGQTAPGEGITISGYDTNLSNSENIIIRYLRFRPGALNVYAGGDSMDAMWGRDNDGFMIDHCSFSWNTDECLSLYRGENGTVQWCLVYESLTLSGHKKGRHGYGGITGGDKVTYHHNLYANHTSRNPRLGGGYAGQGGEERVAAIQFSNNLIYNWGFNTTYGGGTTYTNYMNNYNLAGPGTRDNVEKTVINPGEASLGGFYINGNYLANYTDRLNGVVTPLLTKENMQQYGDMSETTREHTTLATEPYHSWDTIGINHGITNQGFEELLENGVDSAETIFDEILNKAGATYPTRDAQDARITSEVRNGEGRYINTEHEVGGFLSAGGVILEQREAGYDTDADGMPDAWEEANGLQSQDASDATEVTALSETVLGVAGYTNLEVYLNSIVEIEHVAENPNAVITAPTNNQMIDEGTDITVAVSAESAFGHELGKVEFYYGTLTASQKFAEAVITNGNATATLSGLKDGSYFIMARVYDAEGNVTQTSVRQIHVNADEEELKQAGWTSVSIGDVDLQGQASLVDGVLTVKGNGKFGKEEGSLSGTTSNDASLDAFHYAYQECTGDVEITAKLESISSVDNLAFAGIAIREDLDADAKEAILGLSWTKTDDSIGIPWAMYMTSRDTKGGNISYLGEDLNKLGEEGIAEAAQLGILLRPSVKFKNGPTELGYWMRLVRKGDIFTAYCSADGNDWEVIGSKTVEMSEKVYIGFAADSNRVANEIEQLNTARFSNVSVKTQIYDIDYQIEGINLANRPETVTEGNDLVLWMTTEVGYKLPETVTVQIGEKEPQEAAVHIIDPMEGSLVITGIDGAVTITAQALVDTIGVPRQELIEYDTCDALTITEENGALILSQTATNGTITSRPWEGKLAENVSYYAFPKTTDAQTMEMDITILDRTDDSNKNRGLFVGVFEIGNGREYFNSLGFRNCSGTDGSMGGLTGYWMKSSGAGNGGSKTNNGCANVDWNTKPSYELNKTYHVKFEKTNNGYKVSYQGTYADAASGVYPAGLAEKTEMDLYKAFGYDMLQATDEVQYGFALTGVTAKIENLTLLDSKGRTLYDQNDVKVDGSTEEEDKTDSSDTKQPESSDSNRVNSGSLNTKENENKPSSTGTKSIFTKIEEEATPLMATMDGEVVFRDAKATLRLALLQKYYGKNRYMMAHLGNGIGYTIANDELGKVSEDVMLGSSIEKMADFAKGFETFRLKPMQEKKLGYQIGLHVNVGKEYVGAMSYIFSKNLSTNTYELVKIMPVNEIGNIATYTDEMTEVMILIQK